MSRHHITSAALGITLILGMGCESKKSGYSLGQAGAGACDVTLDSLAGTEWNYLQATPEGNNPAPRQGRVKFYSEAGQLKAKYNAGSVSSMYDYNCTTKGNKLSCREKALPADWCRSLLAGGGTCDVASIQAVDDTVDPAAAAKGVADGTKEFQEAKKKLKGADLKRFLFVNNNLGNKLQARMYVELNEKKCQLRIADMYMTIFQGKAKEDNNPNGRNAFVKNELGEQLWENCDGQQSKEFVARPEMGFPKNPAKVSHMARYSVGQQVQFTYLGMDGQSAPPGCTFGFDIWIDGKNVAKDLTPGAAKVKHKGKMIPVSAWLWDKKYEAPSGPQGEIVSMVRHKTCGGAKEVLGAACVAVKAQ